MAQKSYPADVISVCSASGEIRPLRLRIQDEENEMLRLDISEVVGIKYIPYVGAEATVFLCRAKTGKQEWMIELRYAIRTHSWCILRRIY